MPSRTAYVVIPNWKDRKQEKKNQQHPAYYRKDLWKKAEAHIMQTKTLKKRLKPFPQLQSVGMPRNPEPLDRLVTSVINLVGHHYTGRPSKTRGIDPQPTDQLFFLRYLLLRVELWPALGTGNQRFLFLQRSTFCCKFYSNMREWWCFWNMYFFARNFWPQFPKRIPKQKSL